MAGRASLEITFTKVDSFRGKHFHLAKKTRLNFYLKEKKSTFQC
jgi:hypothetical protein